MVVKFVYLHSYTNTSTLPTKKLSLFSAFLSLSAIVKIMYLFFLSYLLTFILLLLEPIFHCFFVLPFLFLSPRRFSSFIYFLFIF